MTITIGDFEMKIPIASIAFAVYIADKIYNKRLKKNKNCKKLADKVDNLDK